MAKFYVASAYRNVTIHPDDRPLLGMQWRGNYFVDLVLPFGLCSAPFIFTSIADLVEWILVHNYGMDFLLHYLDDSFACQCGRPSWTSKSPRMLQAHWAMGLFLTPSGFAVLGLWSNSRYQSRTRSSSPLL